MSVRRGWCPSLHEPMPSGDGLLARIKPRGGLLSAGAVRALAAAADRFGNGMLDLTRRGAVQVRGLTAASAAGFAREMVAARLAAPELGAERRRNVVATPLAGVDPDVHPATLDVTAALEAALEGADDLAALSAKFGVAVDGGGVLALGDVGADIAVTLRADGGAVTLAGGADAAWVSVGDAPGAVLAVVRGFLTLDGAERRMRAVVAERGVAAVFAAAGLRLSLAVVRGAGRGAVGALSYGGGCAVGAGLAFGSAAATDWARLAALAAEFGDGAVRLTPWRTLVVAGAGKTLLGRIGELGFIIDPTDARLRVEACTGRPGCASASVVTRALAARLRPAAGTTIHVSGCDKGCAHPGPAAITLVGRAGGFDLVRQGRAVDAPERRGLSEAEVLAL